MKSMEYCQMNNSLFGDKDTKSRSRKSSDSESYSSDAEINLATKGGIA